MGEVKECGLCGGTDLAVILDMGEQPLAERFGDPRRYPLALAECGNCTLVQLTFAVDQAEVFPPDHPYASGNTAALRNHFAGLAGILKARGLISPGDLVVDIGCNDGTFLAALGDDYARVGVEPTGQGAKCAGRGIGVWRNYFTADVGRGIRRLHGPARVVTACNVLAHVPDPHDFVAGVAEMLAGDGVFVTENHDVASVTGGLQIDAVYHEHLRYFSPGTLARLLAQHGLDVTGTEPVPTHGGSFRAFARRRQGGLQERAGTAAAALREMLAGITASGAAVYGVGATTRAVPLIHYARIAPYIRCVCEVPGSEKTGHLMPGTQIPVVDEVALLEDQPEYALLLAWHVAAMITRKLRAAGYRGKFIVPLPEPRVI